MGDGYVYVVGSDETGHRVKIGWSDNPERRLGQLQTGAPYVLRLLDKHFGLSRKLEDFLHDEFASLRIHGEWFDFGDRDPLPLVAEAARKWGEEIQARSPVVRLFGDSPPADHLKGSALTAADRDILSLHVRAPNGPGGPLRWTRKEMAVYAGISADGCHLDPSADRSWTAGRGRTSRSPHLLQASPGSRLTGW